MRAEFFRSRAVVLPAATLFVVAMGLVAGVGPGGDAARYWVWLGGLVVVGAPVVWRTLRGALRGHFATDVVAMLAIVGAVAIWRRHEPRVRQDAPRQPRLTARREVVIHR